MTPQYFPCKRKENASELDSKCLKKVVRIYRLLCMCADTHTHTHTHAHTHTHTPLCLWAEIPRHKKIPSQRTSTEQGQVEKAAESKKVTRNRLGPRGDHHQLVLGDARQGQSLWAAFSLGKGAELTWHELFNTVKTADAPRAEHTKFPVDRWGQKLFSSQKICKSSPDWDQALKRAGEGGKGKCWTWFNVYL